jgi:hypothetical protein
MNLGLEHASMRICNTIYYNMRKFHSIHFIFYKGVKGSLQRANFQSKKAKKATGDVDKNSNRNKSHNRTFEVPVERYMQGN